MKEKHLSTATQRFLNTEVSITTEGKRHLGAALGLRSFVVCYLQNKLKEWISSIQKLASIARTQPCTCCLLRFHTWLSKQVDILPSHHPWNLRHTAAPQRSNQPPLHPCSDSKELCYHRQERPLHSSYPSRWPRPYETNGNSCRLILPLLRKSLLLFPPSFSCNSMRSPSTSSKNNNV